ncbi:uncharacterized protein (DUF952 family) [Prauserella shujinwangii]|uniref:Uncharacterized protein (DUF952 family) n=1 Tax=Prauserella shujinwangii TaxID=1453103 RepID=A0A2T0LVJ0_9PSEU|nr:DUF952 domain-containing protein [Prauserella shujinwangii]PRX47863.1 uncharacterized protein (DUF952 family) [Prauserella shujinwangii]
MILHICPEADWAALAEGEPYRAASLADVGFVHCSDPGTVHLPAGRLFAGRTDLLLLRIDPARLDVPLRWEPAVPPEPGAPWFPHVYGPIPRDAIVSVHPFPPEPDGSFRLPAELATPR